MSSRRLHALGSDATPDTLTPPRKMRSLRFEPRSQTANAVARTAILRKCLAAPPGSVVLLEAPAGFGKTHVFSQWYEHLREAAQPVAWLSLRASDREPAQLAASLRGALEHAGVQLPSMPAGSPANSTCSQALAEDLVESIRVEGIAATVLLDDYHEAESPDVDRFLHELLDGVGNQLTVAIASRRSIQFPVSRWLLQGRLLRLPKKELLFTKAEVAAVLPAALSSAALQRLFVLTEGWPAAVKLAEVCLDEWRHHVSSLDTLPSYFRMIGEYCSAEVLRGMDPQGTELLTDCAVFEQIEPDLCDAVCQREDSAERLTGLAGRETLLDPLDTAANTWRIPGIMRLHLLRRAAEQGPARLAAIHVRAAQRYEARDDTLAAVRHYVAAGEGRSAALCFERVSPITNACLRGDVLGAAILELIPPQYVAQFPRLALCRVYLDYKMGLLEEARYLLETLAVRTSNFTHDRDGGDDDQLVAESLAATLLMDLYRLSGVSRMYLQSAEDRITRITRINPRLAGFAHEIVGIFYAMRGDLDVAGEHFIQCEKLTTQEPAPWVDLWLIYHRASQALARGLLMEARHHLHTGFRTWRRDFPTNKTFGASVNLLLAVIDYESDALEEAQAKIDDALYTVSHIEGWHEQYAVAYETATMILASTGRYDDAYEFLTRVSSNKRVHAVLEEFVALLRMRVALMQSGAGNVPIEAGYLHVGAGWGPPATHDAMNCRAWDLTGLCLCISAILAKDLERATAVLDTLEKAARVSRRLRTLVKALVLRAAVCARQGAQQEVMTYMVQALEIGRTQGYRRTFLDEGWLIRPILAQLAQAQAPQLPGRLSLFAGRLLAALDARGAAGSSGSKLLSEREIEVLRELNLGHANKVISRKLDLRESTVKFHLQNIFRKLGVRRRDAALADARRRGLLD